MGLKSNYIQRFCETREGFVLRVYLIVTILLVAGCAASTVAPENSRVVDEVVPFIQDGKTSRNEVLSRLGDPDYRHEGGRILAYRMWRCAMEEQVPLSAETRCRDPGKYNLVLVFGPHNLVERHSLVRVK